MNLEDLRALLAVVEYGSFQGAASGMGVPRSRLRRQVSSLEAEIGASLVHRQSQGVELTAAGEVVVRRAGPLLGQASTLVAEARMGERGVFGTLRLIVPVGLPSAPRIRALTSLARLHPGIAVDVVEADEPLAHLRSPFDFLIHFGATSTREGWFSRVLMRLPVVLMASPAYLSTAGTPATVEELAEHRLLAWRAESRLAEAWPRAGAEPVPIVPAVTSANAMLLAQLAHAGGGIALLPQPLTLFMPQSAELVPVLEGAIGGEVILRALSPRASRSDPRLRALVENIQTLLDGLGPTAEASR